MVKLVNTVGRRFGDTAQVVDENLVVLKLNESREALEGNPVLTNNIYIQCKTHKKTASGNAFK